MGARSTLAGTAAILALGVGGATAPAVAASETHLTGTFTGITSQGCTSGNPNSWGPVTGTWRVNVGSSTASARFIINLNGAPHVAFTIPLRVTSRDGTVVATAGTAAGPLTVTVGRTAMAYVIAPYDSTTFPDHQAACQSVTYTGVVTS